MLIRIMSPHTYKFRKVRNLNLSIVYFGRLGLDKNSFYEKTNLKKNTTKIGHLEIELDYAPKARSF